MSSTLVIFQQLINGTSSPCRAYVIPGDLSSRITLKHQYDASTYLARRLPFPPPDVPHTIHDMPPQAEGARRGAGDSKPPAASLIQLSTHCLIYKVSAHESQLKNKAVLNVLMPEWCCSDSNRSPKEKTTGGKGRDNMVGDTPVVSPATPSPKRGT